MNLPSSNTELEHQLISSLYEEELQRKQLLRVLEAKRQADQSRLIPALRYGTMGAVAGGALGAAAGGLKDPKKAIGKLDWKLNQNTYFGALLGAGMLGGLGVGYGLGGPDRAQRELEDYADGVALHIRPRRLSPDHTGFVPELVPLEGEQLERAKQMASRNGVKMSSFTEAFLKHAADSAKKLPGKLNPKLTPSEGKKKARTLKHTPATGAIGAELSSLPSDKAAKTSAYCAREGSFNPLVRPDFKSAGRMPGGFERQGEFNPLRQGTFNPELR
jgi:hypothetical protein